LDFSVRPLVGWIDETADLDRAGIIVYVEHVGRPQAFHLHLEVSLPLLVRLLRLRTV
jgi:hypothetical protein